MPSPEQQQTSQERSQQAPPPGAEPPAADARQQSERPAPEAPANRLPPESPAADSVGAGVGGELSEQMEAQIDEAMRAMEAEDAAEEVSGPPTGGGAARPAAIRGPRKVEGGREHRTGTVVSVGPNEVFLEFGPKELGIVERNQWKDGGELPAVGSALEVVVQRYEPNESLYICVLPGAVQKADWELLEKGQTIEARVTGVVKGGIELEVSGHRAFMPASHISLERIDDLSVFVGEKMVCQVDRVDRRGKGNIVLSRRNLLREERREQAQKLREGLEVGQSVEGIVRRIVNFGAFVDIGGIDGLVHVSDLSHDRVAASEKAVAQHLSVGERVRVQVLKVDWENDRISLGIKQLEADPLEAVSDQVVEGATLTGRVKNITDFGVFVEVAPKVEGLVHISELAWKRVGHPSEVVKADEVVQVKVLKVEPESKKVSLSIKQLTEAPQRPAGGGGGGRGKGGRGGRGTRDDRDPQEILKETPEFRRLREKAKQREKEEARKRGGGGLGDIGGLGEGLGNLRL